MPSVWTDGEDSTSQGLHTFALCRGLFFTWGGRGGVKGSPRPVNDLIGSQPRFTTKKAWITRGGGGGSIFLYATPPSKTPR